MKTVTATVKVTFGENIKDKGLVIHKILKGLDNWCQNSESGLGANENYTVKISVESGSIKNYIVY